MGLDISRISIDRDYNIIGCHRSALLPNEGSNKVSNPDNYTASKPNLGTTQCAKYLLNEKMNINPNTTSFNFSCKDYGVPTTLPKDRKEIQPGRISRKEGNRPEVSHLTSFQKEHYSEK